MAQKGYNRETNQWRSNQVLKQHEPGEKGMNHELTPDTVVNTVYTIAEVLNASLERHQLLERTLQALTQQLGYKAASVRLLDPELQVLEIQAATGLSQRYLAKGPVEVAHSLVDREVLQGQAVALYDIRHDERWQYPEEAEREGIHSVLAVPLRIQGRYLGVLRVYTGEPHQFSKHEQLLVGAVGNLLARALRNTRFYHAIHKVAAEVNSSLELDRVLQALLDSVITEINCKAASIRLLGPRKRRLHLVATRGLSDEYLQKGEIVVAESPIDRKVLQGEIVSLYDVQSEPGFQYPEAAAREGIRSVLVVPLAVREQIIGVLRAYSAQRYRFNDDEIVFLKAIADLGAIAIENARLHKALNEKYEAARDDWAGWYRYLTFS